MQCCISKEYQLFWGGGGVGGAQGSKNTFFFQGLAIKLRFAVNWSNPRGLPQTAYVMTGKKRTDINKPTSGFGAGIIILRIHPRCMEIGISDPHCRRASEPLKNIGHGLVR